MKSAKIVAMGIMATALLGLGGFSQVAYGADLVVNGSFEDNIQAPNSWKIYSGLAGWTGVPNIELRNNVAGTAYDGVNFVEMDTTSNSAMKQTLTGDAGWYQLSFWYSARPNTGATNNLTFTLDGYTATVLDGVSNATSSNIWKNYTASIYFDGSGDLSFSAAGLSDSYGGSLDKVSFTTAVPEPETYVMLLVGLGLMGGIARHRSKAM